MLRHFYAPEQSARALALQIWATTHGVAELMLAGHFGDKPEQAPALLDESVAALIEAAVRKALGVPRPCRQRANCSLTKNFRVRPCRRCCNVNVYYIHIAGRSRRDEMECPMSCSHSRPAPFRRVAAACAGGPSKLVAMILGFVLFWPVGLAILGWKIFQAKTQYAGDFGQFAQEKWGGFESAAASAAWPAIFGGRPGSSGNSAFDDWRKAELERLEEERRKIYEAEKAFYDYQEGLRQAKDREEFERFMASRAASSAPQGRDPKTPDRNRRRPSGRRFSFPEPACAPSSSPRSGWPLSCCFGCWRRPRPDPRSWPRSASLRSSISGAGGATISSRWRSPGCCCSLASRLGLWLAPDFVPARALPLSFLALALAVFVSLGRDRPWTADYAPAAHPGQRESPIFIGINMALSSLWMAIFLGLGLLAWFGAAAALSRSP